MFDPVTHINKNMNIKEVRYLLNCFIKKVFHKRGKFVKQIQFSPIKLSEYFVCTMNSAVLSPVACWNYTSTFLRSLTVMYANTRKQSFLTGKHTHININKN